MEGGCHTILQYKDGMAKQRAKTVCITVGRFNYHCLFKVNQTKLRQKKLSNTVIRNVSVRQLPGVLPKLYTLFFIGYTRNTFVKWMFLFQLFRIGGFRMQIYTYKYIYKYI